MKLYLLWNLPFFKIVLPKTNFFSFLKPWADNGSTNQYSCQLFYGQGMTHLVPSCLKNTYFRRGAWWNFLCLEVSLLSDYSLLTDIKCLAENWQAGTLSFPFWCLCQRLSLSLLYFNKTLLHKSSKWSGLTSDPQIEFLSSRGHKSRA